MSNTTDALGWDSIIWDAINKAVHDETPRPKIVLPLNGPVGRYNLLDKGGLLPNEARREK